MLVVRFSALRLAQACTAAAVLGTVLVPTGAAADDVTSGQTVVGEIVQAWPEHKSPSEAAAQGDEGPLTWIQTPSGDAVRVPTDDLTAELGNPRDGVPVGATVQVVLGGESTDDGAAGKTLDPALDVLSAQVVAAPPADAPALPAAATDQVTVVMMIPAGGAPESGRTLADVEAAINGPVATFWSGQSGNTIRITTATGNDPNWVQATADCSDPYGLWNEAAAHANWTPGTGKHLLVYLPRNSAGCAYGLAQVGSSVTGGGKLYVTDVVPSLLAHELGHNFGLGHSSERQCELGTESGTCRDVAYRDYYDVMGVSGPWLGSLNAPQAARLGVLPAAQQVEVTSTSASARYTLSPYSGTTGVRAIKLTSAGGVDYWLEYRTATGQDSWLGTATNVYGLQEGVELRRATTGSDTSMLLDGTPSAAANWNGDWSVALPVGVPVAVTGSTFTVTVDSMTPTGATVQVGQLPTGNWESVSVAGPALTMTGWTFDPDAVNDAVTVQVDVDGQRTPVTADQSRPDVGAAFPGVGDGHGFTASTTVTPGGHHVCLYAVDVDVPDRNTALGCRTVTTQMAMPRGNWENVSAAGSTVSVSGWAFDPDDGGRAVPLLVHVDGEETPVTADGSRPDVGAAFPGVGDGHGFSGSISVAPGEHRVCVDAVNTDPAGGYTSLGCRTVGGKEHDRRQAKGGP